MNKLLIEKLLILLLLMFPVCASGQTIIDSLQSALSELPQDSQRVKTNLALYEAIKFENPDEAISHLQQALKLAEDISYQTGVVNSYLALGYFLEINSEYDSALAIFRKAESMSDVLKKRALLLESLTGQGMTLRSLSQWEDAISIILQCIEIAMQEPVDSLIISNNYNHLGNIYSDQNQFEEALDYYQKCVSFIQGRERKTAIVTMNIGLIHYRLEDYEKATQYFLECLAIAERIDAKLVTAHGYQKIGMVKRIMNEPEAAKNYYRQAINLFEVVNDRSMLAFVHSNLAGIYTDEENYDLAIEELTLSLSLQEAIEDQVGRCYTLNNIGMAYRGQNDFPNAIKYFKKAKEVATDVGVLLVNKDAAESLSEIYAESGDFQKAYLFHKEFKVLDDSTFNETKASRIAELEEKYQNEQKQQEINLLSAENQIATLELQKQQNLRNYLIIAAFLLVLLVGVVYSRYQVKARANAKLKELDKLKTTFFTNISHELRTPLTLILSPLQKLLHTQQDKENEQALQLMHFNASKLTELINQLLDLSKLEAGKLSLQVHEGNLNELLKIVSASFETMASVKNITFTTAIHQTPGAAYYDEGKVQQILNNLLSNAFKFTPEGKEVVLRSELKGNSIHITVQDAGPGIPTEEQEQIFRRFHQSKTNAPGITGTGVGLTLSKELALLHNGDITVESSYGQGATFTFVFPISKNSYETNQIVSVSTQITANEQNTFEDSVSTEKDTNKQIRDSIALIVEDNPDLRFHMSSLLQHAFSVEVAENGKRGIEIAKKIVPDIIITDLMMPEMDGIELSEEIRKDEKTSHIPIIMLTAKSDRETKLAGLETGADDFLTKPFDNDELSTRVNNLINQRKRLQEKYAKKITLSPTEVDLKSPDELFIQRALQIVNDNLSNSEFTVELFQKEMGMSRMQLHRKLKFLTNFSASEFIRDLRLQRASSLLAINGINITEVAYSCGFNSTSYFTRCFKEKFGVIPSKHQEKVS
ncbi:MAG: tetratricopeptide repeat protein [Bacteroidota bacterium]